MRCNYDVPLVYHYPQVRSIGHGKFTDQALFLEIDGILIRRAESSILVKFRYGYEKRLQCPRCSVWGCSCAIKYGASMLVSSSLAVYLGDAYVGTLYPDTPLAFAYDARWLRHPQARALAAGIPLQVGKIAGDQVYAFFENLLPEGEQRQTISRRHQVSSVFELLALVGGDTAGAVRLLPPAEKPRPPLYRRSSWNQLHGQIDVGLRARSENECTATRQQQRISISGAQFKILLSIDQDGTPLLPLGSSPSSHIIKPDIVHAGFNIFASAMNETVVMRAALHCGLPTAEVQYVPALHACAVTRFDRQKDRYGRWVRLAQADFCQLTAKPSGIKYEADGGPGFVECFHLLAKHSSMPAVDQKNLLKWLFFNLYTGNNDGHAKNLAMLAGANGLRLAPFYDLMCTRLYAGLARRFALRIGGVDEPGVMRAAQFEQLAQELGVSLHYLKDIADELAKIVPLSIHQASLELNHGLTAKEQTLIQRLQQKTTSLTKQLHARIMR